MSDWTLHEGDCLQVLRGMADKSVDHVICDPPYDAHTHKNAATKSEVTRDHRGVSFVHLEDPAVLAKELLRVSRRWVLAFCAIEQIAAYREGAGIGWVRSGIWDKIAPSPQISGDRPGQAVEGIAIMHPAGRKRWNRGGGAGIWRFMAPQGADRPDHPTPKPVPLMAALISDFTDPGETILDPFAGSGTTGVAALRLGRNFIGCELDPKYAALARERLEAETRGSTLSASRVRTSGIFGSRTMRERRKRFAVISAAVSTPSAPPVMMTSHG